MLPNHNWFPALSIKLLENHESTLVKAKHSLSITMRNIQGIRSSVARDVVLLQNNRQDFVAGVIYSDTGSFEDLRFG